jgi:hypothetical protein
LVNDQHGSRDLWPGYIRAGSPGCCTKQRMGKVLWLSYIKF